MFYNMFFNGVEELAIVLRQLFSRTTGYHRLEFLYC